MGDSFSTPPPLVSTQTIFLVIHIPNNLVPSLKGQMHNSIHGKIVCVFRIESV